MSTLSERARALWVRSERVRGPAFFGSGVALDYATLQLQDWVDQVLITGSLWFLLLAVALSERADRRRWLPEPLERVAWLLPPATQFLLGALLSALAISVWRALHPGPGALFLSLLAALALANETRPGARRSTTARFATAAALSYQMLAILIPLATGALWGPLPAVLGASILMIGCIGAAWVEIPGREPPRASTERGVGLWLPAISSAGGIAALLFGTWLGLVPPLPLAMTRAAVATGVERTPTGPELLDARWTDDFARLMGRPTVSWRPGDQVVVYTAISAPPGMELALFHTWEHYDAENGWTGTDRIELDVRGGRELGFRTWSRKRHLSPGDWRVRVLSPYDQELGRVMFRVETAEDAAVP